jgi:hypothetical protein
LLASTLLLEFQGGVEVNTAAVLKAEKENQVLQPQLTLKKKENILATSEQAGKKNILATFWLPFVPSRCCPFREFSRLISCHRQ